MREHRWRLGPAVVRAVDVGDRDTREGFIGHALETADVDAVHLADGGLVADAERAHAATAAEEMLVLARVEAILDELARTARQPEPIGCRDRDPEARPATNRAVAAE